MGQMHVLLSALSKVDVICYWCDQGIESLLLNCLCSVMQPHMYVYEGRKAKDSYVCTVLMICIINCATSIVVQTCSLHSLDDQSIHYLVLL